MAHVHAYGDRAPRAPSSHLGCTSQDINCNTELPQLRDALHLVCIKTARVIDAPASPLRAPLERPPRPRLHPLPARAANHPRQARRHLGLRPLPLPRTPRTHARRHQTPRAARHGHAGLVPRALRRRPAPRRPPRNPRHQETRLRRGATYLLSGQTCPRVVDAFALSELANLASVIHKACNDVRLMASRKELDEPFGESQIGSSAMPYKRAPHARAPPALSRLRHQPRGQRADTAATQWLERTLDDSANRAPRCPRRSSRSTAPSTCSTTSRRASTCTRRPSTPTSWPNFPSWPPRT